MSDTHEVEARTITDEEHQTLVTEAFQLERQVKEGLARGREALWATAEALYEFSEAQGWKLLGGYDTLGDWLADPEISLTRSTYFRLVETWREVVVRREIEPESVKAVDLSKVALTLPAVKDGRETIEGALDAAATNGWRDLRERYLIATPDNAITHESYEPTGDGVETNGDYTEPPPPPMPDEDLYGTEMIQRGVAQTVTIALEAVMAVHPPERRSMSKELHALGTQALEIAHSEGLGNA
jgi:hypothetical protein